MTATSKKVKMAAAVAGVFLLMGVMSYFFQDSLARLFHIPPDAKPVVAGIKEKLKLPQVVDGSTRLDDVQAGEGKIMYFMTILKPREQALDRAAYMNYFLLNYGCKSDEYLKLLQARFTVEIHYRDLDGKPAQTVVLKPETCGLPS